MLIRRVHFRTFCLFPFQKNRGETFLRQFRKLLLGIFSFVLLKIILITSFQAPQTRHFFPDKILSQPSTRNFPSSFSSAMHIQIRKIRIPPAPSSHRSKKIKRRDCRAVSRLCRKWGDPASYDKEKEERGRGRKKKRAEMGW